MGGRTAVTTMVFEFIPEHVGAIGPRATGRKRAPRIAVTHSLHPPGPPPPPYSSSLPPPLPPPPAPATAPPPPPRLRSRFFLLLLLLLILLLPHPHILLPICNYSIWILLSSLP
eukprot:9490655-Pyramimonas_sp.AAC.1